MKTKPSYIDPICGMSVSPETARGEIEFEGNKYYFCSNTYKNKRQKSCSRGGIEPGAESGPTTLNLPDRTGPRSVHFGLFFILRL